MPKSEQSKCRKLLYDRDYYRTHKPQIRERKRKWQKRNMVRICRHQAERKRENLQYRLTCNLRARLNRAIRGKYKGGSAVDDLGCSIEKFVEHIASLFKSGMKWDNYGEWHLDHVKPLCLFDLSDRNECLKAVHFTNYQPLWATENLSKNRRYDADSKSSAS